MISKGHQFSPPSCRNSQKKEKPSSCTKLSPHPLPQKKTTISTLHKPHTYLTQTYPNFNLSTNVQTLGRVNSCVTFVKFSTPKKALQNFSNKNSFPPASTSPLRCRCGPVGRQYVEGRLRSRLQGDPRLRHRGYRGDQGDLHFGGYG